MTMKYKQITRVTGPVQLFLFGAAFCALSINGLRGALESGYAATSLAIMGLIVPMLATPHCYETDKLRPSWRA